MTKVTGYIPTAEQLEAQKARRAAQAAEKADKKASKFGGKTITDPAGKFVSQPADVTIQKNKFGGVTITDPADVTIQKKQPIPIGESNVKPDIKPDVKKVLFSDIDQKPLFDFKPDIKPDGKQISLSDVKPNPLIDVKPDINPDINPDVNPDVKHDVKQDVKKSKGFMSKIRNVFKSKGGKIGLISAGIAAVIGAGVYLFNKLTGENTPEQTTPTLEPNKAEKPAAKPATPEEKPAPAAGDEKAKKPDEKSQAPATSDEKAEKPDEKSQAPIAGDEKAEKPEKTGAQETEKTEEKVSDDANTEYYIVKKNDCVWNIAKKHLKEMNSDPDYKPTNAEILKHTKELMSLNNLEYESDGYRVIIHPKDKLKLSA